MSIKRWVTSGTATVAVAVLCIAFTSNVNAFDIKAAKQQLIQKNDQLSHHLAQQPRTYAPAPAPTPKPPANIAPVQSWPGGYWGIAALDHGQYHVTDLWHFDYHQDLTGGWNDVFLFSGTLSSDPTQGVIGEFTLNGGDFHVWNVPDTTSNVHIVSVNGRIIKFSADKQSGVFNLLTSKFNR